MLVSVKEQRIVADGLLIIMNLDIEFGPLKISIIDGVVETDDIGKHLGRLLAAPFARLNVLVDTGNHFIILVTILLRLFVALRRSERNGIDGRGARPAAEGAQCAS